MRREGDGLPFTEHRTRDLSALFSEAEWGWSTAADEAYVFEMHGLPEVSALNDYERSAEFHALALRRDGEKWACHCTHGEQARYERESRRKDREEVLRASVQEVTTPTAPVTRRAMGRAYRGPRRTVASDPAEVFARNEKEHLA